MAEFYKGQRLTHLNKYEVYIWKKFLDKYGNDYHGYTYDVHLPINITMPADLEQKFVNSAEALTAKRIDVVMFDPSTTWIVEIRPDAKQSAVGSLIFYRYLYLLKYNPIKQVQLMLVTDYNNAELALVCKEIGIKYLVM